MALHVTAQPRKSAHQRSMNVEPMAAKPAQTDRALAPHQTDRRDHQTTGVAGAPPSSQTLKVASQTAIFRPIRTQISVPRPNIFLPVFASVQDASQVFASRLPVSTCRVFFSR